MALFPDLALELIDEILQLLLPNDIDNLLLISKAFYAMSSPATEEHRKLKRQYCEVMHVAAISHGERLEFSSDRHLEDLLKTVIANPRIGHYIKRLVIIGCERSVDFAVRPLVSPPDKALRNRRCTDESIELFKRVASTFPAISVPGMEPPLFEEWDEDLTKSDKAALVALILMHCPNLSYFEFEDRGANTQRIFDLFQYMARAKDCKPLTQLKHVRFRHAQCGNWRFKEDINRLKALLALPSLESIKVSNLDKSQGKERGNPTLFQCSDIKSLSFTRCPIGNKSMFELLEATKHLKCFSIFSGPCVETFDYYWLRAALLATARDSLQALYLRADWTSRKIYNMYLGPLKAFTTLQSIEVDHVMLADPNKSGRLMQLEDHLPSSLQSLKFWTDGASLALFETCLYELIYLKNNGDILPKAQKIALYELPESDIRKRKQAIKHLKVAFESQGISFSAT